MSVIFLNTPTWIKKLKFFLKSLFFEMQKKGNTEINKSFPNCSAMANLVLNLESIFSSYLKATYWLEFIILLSEQEIIGEIIKCYP